MNMQRIAKGAVKSKTNWLSLAVIILSWLQLAEQKEALARVLSPDVLPLVSMVVGGALIVMRFFTTQSLLEKGTSKEEGDEQSNA